MAKHTGICFNYCSFYDMAIHCSIEVFFMNKYNSETFLLFIFFFKPIIEMYIKLSLCRPLTFLAHRTKRVIMFGIVDLGGLLMAIKKVFFQKGRGIIKLYSHVSSKGVKGEGAGVIKFYPCLFSHLYTSCNVVCWITEVPLKQIIWNWYTTSETIQEKPCWISNFTTFSVREICSWMCWKY